MTKILRSSVLLLLTCAFTWAYGQRTISGVVTSKDDESVVPGVNVILQGTTIGTTTDLEGRYRLSVPQEGGVLVFSFIGFASQQVEIGNRSIIDVKLLGDTKQLDEVVVLGYGTTLKKELTGAVSSIKTEQLQDLPVLSPQQALQGQTSGVLVTAGSGAPGGAISVRVRGQTSINASNEPLYIVDGVILTSTSFQLAGYGGQGQNALAGINIDDIASIEVLKDAASTAIYGARAANGVVLITTKSGKKGKASINLDYWTGWSNPVGRYKMLSAQQWVDIENEAYTNDNSGAEAPDNSYWGWDGTTNTNWMNKILRTARTSNYQLNASGGTDVFNYYISGGYRDEEGTIINSGLKRYSGRFNFTVHASDRLEIGTKTSASVDKVNRIQSDNDIYGIYSAAILTPSIEAVKDEEGNYVDALPSFNTNPVRDALLPTYLNTTRRLVSNFYFNYKILEGLDFRTDLNYDYVYFTEDQYEPEETAQGRSSDGYGLYTNVENGRYMIEPTLRYNTSFADKHNLNVVLGGSWQSDAYISNYVEGVGYTNSTLKWITSAATITDGSSYSKKYTFQSFFGRASYNFKEKYIATATLRRDGSSRFGKNNKYGIFYALSAGWNFVDESFMAGLPFISFGKLRASYGITGNDNFSDFQYLGTWVSSNYLDASSSVPSTISNQNLKWEQTRNIDFGVDLGFFKDRINLSVGVFQQRTTNLLYQIPTPYTTGFSSYWGNLGAMLNKGLEIDLNTTVYKNSDLSVSVGGNISFLKNRVVSISSSEPVSKGFGSAIVQGRPINTFYMVKWLGVDPATGQSMFQDYNGDGQITAEDAHVVGDYSPDYLGGFNTTITYKGFSLNALFQYVHGVDIYNYTLAYSSTPAYGYGMTSNMMNRWQKPGDVTDTPKPTLGSSLDASLDNTRWLSDGSYLRLKTITLSYNLPSDIVSKLGIKSMRVYATGQNLLTFTKYNGVDPEVNTFSSSQTNSNTAAGTEFLTQPQSKMFLIGASLGF